MRAPSDVALILLAAGTSQRFGATDKLLADLGGRPLIEHAIRALSDVEFGERIAVVNDTAGATAAVLRAAGYRLAVNHAPRSGLGKSLALGVSSIHAATACLICLGDMPCIEQSHIRAILAAGGDCVASRAGGVNQPPALFDCRHFPALSLRHGERGAPELLRDALGVETSRQSLMDVDCAGDLDRLRVTRI